jgi:hypothetical protein
MSYKDTLTLYNELKAAGIGEEQAQIQAKQLGGISETMGDFSALIIKIEKDLMWMRLIGGAMTLAFLSSAVWGH